MIPFIIGIFIGATLGIFIMSWFAMGALSDLHKPRFIYWNGT